MSCADMAEPIRELSGVWTQVGLSNHLLGGAYNPTQGRGKLGNISQPIVDYGEYVASALNWSRCCLGCGLGWAHRTWMPPNIGALGGDPL